MSSWQLTIRNQRKAVLRRLEDTPSLKGKLVDNRWLEAVWSDAVIQAATETGLSDFSEECPWTLDEILESSCFFE